MEVFSSVKITKPEAFRVAAVEFAIQLHNFRTDVVVSAETLIEDAKRIKQYLENGT